MVRKILVSVVVPTFDRLDYLRSCLRSLFSQSFDNRLFEVIVVDDGSSDGTESYVRSLQKRRRMFSGVFNFPVLRYYRQSNCGPASARNFGALHASGLFLAFLDDDCVAHRSWLKEIVGSFDKFPDAAYIGGYIIPVHKNVLLREVTKFKRLYGNENRNKVERIFKGPDVIEQLIYTDNSAIRKSAFIELKGFNTTLRYGEDCDLCLKLLDKDYAVYRVYSMQVDHNQRDTISSLFKRHYDFGRMATVNYRDHFKGYTRIRLGYLLYHENRRDKVTFNVGRLLNIYLKSGFTISVTRYFFKDILVIFLLFFFWPVFALVLLLIKLLDRYIFETKTIKATLSLCWRDLIIDSAFFVGGVVGSFKNKIIYF